MWMQPRLFIFTGFVSTQSPQFKVSGLPCELSNDEWIMRELLLDSYPIPGYTKSVYVIIFKFEVQPGDFFSETEPMVQNIRRLLREADLTWVILAADRVSSSSGGMSVISSTRKVSWEFSDSCHFSILDD